MILLDIENIRKHYGPEPVLAGVTLQVRPGERIGLVGPNGCGKTTLLKILAGREEADAGACRRHPAVHLGYLEQQPKFEPGRTLHEEALSALEGLVALEAESLSVAAEMAETQDELERNRLAARFDHLQQELLHRDAYNIENKIERVLDGLGFRRESRNQPVDSLSGGEQNRLILAKLLLAEPNLMLLDEPSNHLDIAATEWLESFLVESSASVVVVSHDRYFLDRVTNRTFELFRGTIDAYTGNFSAYWQQKAERMLVQSRTYEKQQIEIAKTEEFIRKNFYGMKAGQAEDRRKKLARIEPVEPPREIAGPPMGFPEPTRSGDWVLRGENLAKSYDRPLFRGVDLEVMRGERWAILGPNGCGKTTLLRCLLGLVEPDQGAVRMGTGVRIGYFDQQLLSVDEDCEVADAIRPDHKQTVTQQRRDLLARFGITGDRALQKVGSLSGGERCRAALARLAASDANFLILDEPTNHLDLWARDSLEKAIVKFAGTVLFVSHDRYFVNQVADHVLVVEPDGFYSVDGNYDALEQYRQSRAAMTDDKAAAFKDGKQAMPKDAKQSPASADRGGKGRGNADNQAKPSKPKRKFPYRKLAEIEDEIFIREARVGELQAILADGNTYRDASLVRRTTGDLELEQKTLAMLYEHWEEASLLGK